MKMTLLLPIVSLMLSLAPWTTAYAIQPQNPQEVVRVGPTRAVRTIAAAAKLVPDGGIVEVDAGEYRGDVAVWANKNARIHAIGGRVRLDAAGAAASGKGIWVVRGGKIEIDGFDFVNAAVPDRNGAGIRLDKGHLIVRNSTFFNNQNGILTGNNKESIVEIENCEFGKNGIDDGHNHNIYIGQIKKLFVTGSYFHHGRSGHLLKSRAAENHIRYNRLTDEIGGRASYELEFPNGGIAYVIGNVIQQGTQTENPHIVAYGSEGYIWQKNELYLINNTLVDNRPKNGIFLKVGQGNVLIRAINNLLVGKGKLEISGPGEYRNNINVDWDQFVNAQREDYRLKFNSRLIGTAVEPGVANGINLSPEKEYKHPHQTQSTTSIVLSPGAMQTIKDSDR